MGGNQSHEDKTSHDAPTRIVSLDDFQILRAIGKGSFGKVCIVQKKSSKQMYAMKYMNKSMCIEKDAVRNVFREMELLQQLSHPFIVNLWFTFQDEEDMFMVVDLLLGGDLRYHIQHDQQFDEQRVTLYICEIALALQYLKENCIIHRDIKPDNILLDEEGHVHLTDFNVATVVTDGHIAMSMSGTKPYMAPEVFACALEECAGYSYAVDWWAMGICAYEMLRGRRPYDIHSGSSPAELKQLFAKTSPSYPSQWQEGMTSLLKQLLTLNPDERLQSVDSLRQHPHMCDINFDGVLKKTTKPSFIPKKDHLNCDPTYELEEMIIESKPLHKKKKRLAKQNSKRLKDQTSTENDPIACHLELIDKEFEPFNREYHNWVSTNPEKMRKNSTTQQITVQSNEMTSPSKLQSS